eukprot:Clim_evm29s149 gene=Clim_evmTU29s149
MTELRGPSAFFDNAERAIEQKADVSLSETYRPVDQDEADDFFESSFVVESLLTFARQNVPHAGDPSSAPNVQVALQFSDDLLAGSDMAVRGLKKKLEASKDEYVFNLFVLADTSYSPCCVDEVAAEHYNAHVVVHYGRSCLSQPSKTHTIFAFTRPKFDIDALISNTVSAIRGLDEELQSGVLICDTRYQFACDEFLSKLLRELEGSSRKIFGSDLVVPEGPLSLTSSQKDESSESVVMNRRVLAVPEGFDPAKAFIVFMGPQSATSENIMMTMSKSKFLLANPRDCTCELDRAAGRLLMKRYYMVQRAREAHLVGVLVGTLSAARYKDALQYVKQEVKSTGRKCYTFVVGKLNIAKLANFAEIDIFVVVACPESTLMDSQDFFKPIVTPFEMHMACNPKLEWTGDYETDYLHLIEGWQNALANADERAQDLPEYSFITGKLVPAKMDLDTASEDAQNLAVMRGQDALIAASLQQSGAAARLQEREYQGLDPRFGETEVQETIKQGRIGIAKGYTHETED